MIINVYIPSDESIKDKYLFIKDEELRQKIISSRAYIIFLISIRDNDNITPSIILNINRDICIITGAIIESMLYYCIGYIENHGDENQKDKIKNKAIKKDVIKIDKKHIIDFPDGSGQQMIMGIRETKPSGIEPGIMLHDMINLSKDINLIKDNEKEKLDQIRKNRNQIHIHSINNEDYIIPNNKIDNIFSDMSIIIKTLENYIIGINIK